MPQKGFTLLELLIVIAIIAIISSVSFITLDPLTRFRDARDTSRLADVSAILTAVKVDQVDNGGSYLAVISALTAGNVYMIGTDSANCNTYACDTAVSAADACVDIGGLVTEGYMGSVPVSPNGAGTWTAGHTGYTIQRDDTGIITVRACESENSGEIKISK